MSMTLRFAPRLHFGYEVGYEVLAQSGATWCKVMRGEAVSSGQTDAEIREIRFLHVRQGTCHAN